jgi:hypothetical protein
MATPVESVSTQLGNQSPIVGGTPPFSGAFTPAAHQPANRQPPVKISCALWGKGLAHRVASTPLASAPSRVAA